MHRRLKVISAILGILIIILFIYAIVNYKFYNKTISDEVNFYVKRYGLAAVFFSVFILEISPQPFLSGLAPLASGMAFGLSNGPLLIVAICSVIVASFSAYSFGIVYGNNVTVRIIGKKEYDRYVGLVKKHGKMALAIAAFSPIPYFPVLAGAFKMNYKDFFVFGVFFRILHYLVFGYFLAVLI